MSGGTSTFKEIEQSVNLITKSELYLMHCVSIYPQDYSEANILKMKKLKSLCKNVGLSDLLKVLNLQK